MWNEDRLELAFRASKEGIWDWNLEKGTIFYSGRTLRFLGYRRADAPHLFLETEKLMDEESQTAFREAYQQLEAEETDLFAVEPRMKTRRGRWKWFRVRGTPVRDDEGKILRLVGSVIDISKRKTAELELVEEQALMASLIENISMSVYFKDLESRFVMANTPTAHKMGLDKVSKLLGNTDADFFSKEHAEGSREQEKTIIRSGVGLEKHLEREEWPDQSHTWVHTCKKPWRGRDGKVKGLFGVASDVTEFIEAQKEQERVASQLHETNQLIEEERHLLRLVIDNVPLNVYFKDRDSCFVLVNQAMAIWLGKEKPEDLQGKSDRDFFSEEHWRAAETDEQKIMRTGESMQGEVERETWGGKSDTWVMTSKYPWKDADGQTLGTFGVSSDVTDLVRAQRDLTSLAETLQKKNQEMEEGLSLAREVQQALIPSELPVYSGWGQDEKSQLKFYHFYQPASELAGDFFEILPLGGDKVGFLVCDVMGHGVRSALVVAMLRGLIEKQVKVVAGAGEFLTGLNEGLTHLLEQSGVSLFATAICGVVDLAEETIELSLAGHPNPIAVFRDGVRQLAPPKEARGPALGMIDSITYGAVTQPLAGLIRLVCFTDGLLEAENEHGEEFGVTRMLEKIEQGGRLAPLFKNMVKSASIFAEQEVFDDDVCLLGLEFSAR